MGAVEVPVRSRIPAAPGCDGAAGPATLDALPPLGEFYANLRAGALSLAIVEGQ